jgi:outer membrane protein TolC
MIRYYYLGIFLSLSLLNRLSAQDTIYFFNLQDLWQEVKRHNHTFKTNAIENEQAALAYKTSLGNIFNPRMPVSLNFVDNTRLPVNLIPAEIFGGPQGVFREVVFGQQFNTLFSFQPQFDIVNMSAIGQISSARINKKLTENQSLLNEYLLYEKVNAIYHNMVSLHAQRKVLVGTRDKAAEILSVVERRYQEGIIRKQEVNEAQVNLILIEDNLEQLVKMIENQEQDLYLLLENKYTLVLPDTFDASVVIYSSDVSVSKNVLKSRNVEYQASMVQQDIKNLQYQYYPVLSFVSGFNWQNLSNDFFLASNSTSFNYNNIGLRFSWDLPTVTRLSTIKNKQYQYQALQVQKEHIDKEVETGKAQLKIDHEKAISQLSNQRKIRMLKEDSYNRYLDQYSENILSLDRLLIAQMDLLTSQLNEVKAIANVSYTFYKISINNQYQN